MALTFQMLNSIQRRENKFRKEENWYLLSPGYVPNTDPRDSSNQMADIFNGTTIWALALQTYVANVYVYVSP